MRESYLYANGVVASLSNNLITKETFARMIDCKTNVEALSTLQETSFASGLVIETPFQIEELLNFETKKLLNFIKAESPIEELIWYFVLPYDYNNISAYCKSIVLNQSASTFIEAEGYYEISKIKEYVSSKSFDAFDNKFIKSALLEFQMLSSKPNIKGDEVDFIFKKYLYQNLREVCGKNQIIKKLVELKIDIENISCSMRANSQYHLEQQILDVATVNKETLLAIFNKNKDALYKVKDEILTKFVKLALQEKAKSFIEYEKLRNQFPFMILEKNKDDINSIGPFATYCFKKDIEIKNVRLIFSYHNNNLSDQIKKRFLEC